MQRIINDAVDIPQPTLISKENLDSEDMSGSSDLYYTKANDKNNRE